MAERCFDSKKASLKGGGTAGRWFSPLRDHVLPKLGKKHVTEITSANIRDELGDLWHDKNPTAVKAFNRLAAVLRFAGDEGIDEGITIDSDTVPRAQRILGKSKHEAEHVRSTPFEEVPALYAAVCDLRQTPSTLALRLTLLTCQRSKPVRIAKLDRSHR